jgi:putative ABC transport system permease protein
VTGSLVLLRGIRYRAHRSAAVAAVAAVAVAAAVLAPGFSRAAEQSVLTDGLAAATPVATAVTIGATGSAGAAPAAHLPVADVRQAVDRALAASPVIGAALHPPVAGVHTGVLARGGGEQVATRLAYRDRVCEALTITGSCPTGPGEVLVGAEVAEQYGIALGDRLTLDIGDDRRRVDVVGTYRPVDPGALYWGRTAYFTQGGFDPATGAPRVAALFTAVESDVRVDPSVAAELQLTYPLHTDVVRLDDVAALRADLAALEAAVRVADLDLHTALPAILDGIAADQSAINRIAPVVAAPLLLLAWFVLFLLVAMVTEERGREIALAKLRGFTSGRAARFGLGEVLVLIVAATPVGIAAGLGVVELASRVALADGTHVELRPPVFVAAGVALAAAAVAALLAGRSTLRRGALTLLRRVPPAGRWRAGALEGAVLALAGASLVVAVGDRTAGLAMLAPALLAVVAGIAAATLVRWWSAVRLRMARRRGNLPGLLAAAHLSRRPAGPRTVVTVTVAVALLSFAAVAWDVAAQARDDHAVDTLGADRVYSVVADHPAALREAVRAADPSGTAMAVVRSSGQYGGERVELVAVEVSLISGVVRWRGYEGHRSAALIDALRPVTPDPLYLVAHVAVDADVGELGHDPVRLSVVVSVPGEPPHTVPLGTLTPGPGRYTADLPQCGGAGCRLLGLSLGRPGAAGPFTGSLDITAIRTAGGELAAGFDDPERWHGSDPPAVTVRSGAALAVEVRDGNRGDVLVQHRDTATALPAVLAGAAPADTPGAGQFDFPGLAERPQTFAVVDTAPRLPRAGARGLLFDLDHAVAAAERTAALSDVTLTYEVWAGPAAPVDLAQRLAAAGVAVHGAQSFDGTLDQLSRRAPALGFWLYLLAAAAAMVLALGVVGLSGRVGVEHRLSELAALRTCGVPAGVLRRALLREQATLLGWPLLVGTAAGLAAAALMLPGIPLVEAGTATAEPAGIAYRAVPVAAAAILAGVVATAARALRLPRRATRRPAQGGGR